LIYKLTSNPIFPYYNSIFKSPYYAEVSPRDLRWEFNSPSDLFELARGTWGSNLLEFEARFLWWGFTCLVLGFFFVFLAVRKSHLPRFIGKYTEESKSLNEIEKHFLFYVLFAFLIWLKFFFYARYAMFIEILLPSVCTLIIIKIINDQRIRLRIVSLLGFLGIFFLQVPNWNLYQVPENPQNISKSQITSDWKWQIERKNLPRDAYNYYLDGECSCSFLLPSLGDKASFFRLDNEIYGWVRVYPERVKRKISSGDFTHLISRSYTEDEVVRLNEMLKSVGENGKISLRDTKPISTLNGIIHVYKLSKS
jgi:hypothetical protein